MASKSRRQFAIRLGLVVNPIYLSLAHLPDMVRVRSSAREVMLLFVLLFSIPSKSSRFWRNLPKSVWRTSRRTTQRSRS
jgi:hypothetical protein